MNSLQLQNLQNYFQQNKTTVFDENLKKINFDFNQFIQKLEQVYKDGYKCFYYVGENPNEILKDDDWRRLELKLCFDIVNDNC